MNALQPGAGGVRAGLGAGAACVGERPHPSGCLGLCGLGGSGYVCVGQTKGGKGCGIPSQTGRPPSSNSRGSTSGSSTIMCVQSWSVWECML
jgi:hypothetical protein